MNPGSRNNNEENQLVFFFKKNHPSTLTESAVISKAPVRAVTSQERSREASLHLPALPTFSSSSGFKPPHLLDRISSVPTKPLKSSRRQLHQRHLVVKMPAVSIPRAVSPPTMSQFHQQNTGQDNSRKVTFLPPINNQQTIEGEDGSSFSSRSGKHRTLCVTDPSPDSKFDSNDYPRRPTVNITYRKPEMSSMARNSDRKQKPDVIPEPKPLRYVNKYNSLYNSWELGLHSYRIQDDEADTEEPLTFRFQIRQKDAAEQKRNRRPKTPPKDPFKDGILADIDTRRKVKVKDAVTFSATGDLIKGKPVVGEPPSVAELHDMQRGSQGFHRIRQLNLPEEYTKSKDEPKTIFFVDGSEKGSALFQKKADGPKVKRPFDELTNVNPRLLTGKTVLRNPLSPVPLKHRYNPVVVMRSKLDDYTGAIKNFLEQVVEEQRMAAFQKQPLPLSQTVENMVIYQDFDTIHYFKAMQKKLKESQQHTHELQKAKQYNFKAPASNVAKGVAKVQKLGAIVTSDQLEPLPKSGIKPHTGFGQSVFLTNPVTGTGAETGSGGLTPEQSTLQRLLLLSAGIRTPTTAPPNTPHVSRLC